MYTYAYSHTHTHTHTNIHTRTHTTKHIFHLNMYTYVSMHIYMHTRTRTPTHTHTRANAEHICWICIMRMHSMRVYVCMRLFLYICIHFERRCAHCFQFVRVCFGVCVFVTGIFYYYGVPTMRGLDTLSDLFWKVSLTSVGSHLENICIHDVLSGLFWKRDLTSLREITTP